MRSVIRLVAALAISLGVLVGGAEVASANHYGNDPLCYHVVPCWPCGPTTPHRIGPLCYGP